MNALMFLKGPKAAPITWDTWRTEYEGFQPDIPPPLLDWAVALGGLWVLPPAAKGDVALAFGLLCALLQAPAAQARTFKIAPNLAKLVKQWAGGPALASGEESGGGSNIQEVASHLAGLLRHPCEGVEQHFSGPQALRPRDVRRVLVSAGDLGDGGDGLARVDRTGYPAGISPQPGGATPRTRCISAFIACSCEPQ